MIPLTTGNHAIRQLTLLRIGDGFQGYWDYEVITLAGASPFGPSPSSGTIGYLDGVGDEARFSSPVDLVLIRTMPTIVYRVQNGVGAYVQNYNYTIFVTESGNKRVRMVDRNGNVNTFVGTLVTGRSRSLGLIPDCSDPRKF